MTSELKMTVVGPLGLWPLPALLAVRYFLGIVPNLFSYAGFEGRGGTPWVPVAFLEDGWRENHLPPFSQVIVNLCPGVGLALWLRSRLLLFDANCVPP